ncbi:MAG: DUF1501 domain-containing protein [Pseudomonadota bacterium]
MRPISRRVFLELTGAATLLSSGAVFAKGVEGRKFIFVILRGGMDGLSALIPDDPEMNGLRGPILPAVQERLDLQNGFRLHPSLAGVHSLYDLKEAAFIHAAATPFRGRSHFDGQDVLETLGKPGENSGWLNRSLQASGGEGLAVDYAIPLALQGEAPVTNWSPPVFSGASDELLARLSDLYSEDPVFSEAMASAQMTPNITMGRKGRNRRKNYSILLEAMGRLMGAENGPNVGMVSLDGWDTHANQAGDLDRRFRQLNEGVLALKKELGIYWASTCVVVCSEFGRTAKANGTRGTDHGTGGLVMLFGGSVNGGQIYGDWPGLRANQLFEGRDLAPANDIGAILKGVLRDHMGLDSRTLGAYIFPDSPRALDRLIA